MLKKTGEVKTTKKKKIKKLTNILKTHKYSA